MPSLFCSGAFHGDCISFIQWPRGSSASRCESYIFFQSRLEAGWCGVVKSKMFGNWQYLKCRSSTRLTACKWAAWRATEAEGLATRMPLPQPQSWTEAKCLLNVFFESQNLATTQALKHTQTLSDYRSLISLGSGPGPQISSCQLEIISCSSWYLALSFPMGQWGQLEMRKPWKNITENHQSQGPRTFQQGRGHLLLLAAQPCRSKRLISCSWFVNLFQKCFSTARKAVPNPAFYGLGPHWQQPQLVEWSVPDPSKDETCNVANPIIHL